MSATWFQIRNVLDAVLQVPPADRCSFLDRACPEPELRRYIDSIILSYEQAGKFLQPPAFDQYSAAILDPESAETWIGRRLGAYRIEETIGQGGMGIVFRAMRADAEYQKQVAIKLVKGGFGSSFALAQFKDERQILARLEHPNIARLLDGGSTEEGFPYLVMELVEGVPIDEYCDAHRLSITERLRLFRMVCEAVQFAHQNLVIHRDLKPANMLVASDGVPKLLDFGIAKLLSPDALSPPSAETVSFLRVLTPEYASPEQVRGDPLNITTDVYSLGVVLYILLSGHRPYQLSGGGGQTLSDVICNTVPPKPSVAIAQTQTMRAPEGDNPPSVTAAAVSFARGETPEKLRRRLAGDLDNIVLMALRKEPQRRYSSVEQFSDDIRRHLQKFPIVAHSDTLTYRASKFLNRHKFATAAVAAVLVTLLVGMVATLHEARLARTERDRAQGRFNDLRKLSNSLIFDVHDDLANLPGTLNARRKVVALGLNYLNSLDTGDKRADPDLDRDLAGGYSQIADIEGRQGTENLGDTSAALRDYRKAAQIQEAVAMSSGGTDADRAELARIERRLAHVMLANWDLRNALLEDQKSVVLLTDLQRRYPTRPRYRYSLGNAYLNVGRDQSVAGDARSGLQMYTKAFVIFQEQAASGNASDQKGGKYNLGVVYLWMSLAWSDVGDQSQAQEAAEKSLELRKLILQRNAQNVRAQLDFSDSSAALGEVLLKQGHLDTALVHYREALNIAASASVADPNDQRAQEDLADACRGLANSLSQQGQASEALQYAQRALEVTAKMAATNASSPASQNDVAQAYGTLGSAYNARAMAQTRNQAKSRTDIESALACFQKAQAIYEDLTHRGPVPLATTVESQRILQEVSHSQRWLETAHAVGSNKTKT